MKLRLLALILASLTAVSLVSCAGEKGNSSSASKTSAGAASASGESGAASGGASEASGGTESGASGSAASGGAQSFASAPNQISSVGSIPPTTVDLRTAKFNGVKLKRIRWYDMGQEETQMIKDWEKLTGATITDIHVNYENINDRIRQSISANDPIDIGFLYGAFFPQQVIANMYKPVDAYIQSKYLVNTSNPSAGGFDISKMNEYKWKNHYYGFSSYWDVDMLVLYYRTDIFDDYGLETPNQLAAKGQWNWDTFYNLAKEISDNSDGQMNGFSAGPTGNSGHENIWVSGAGSSLVTVKNSVPTINLDDPKLRAGLEFYRKISYGATAVCKPGEGFQAGKAAMCIDGLYLAPKLMASGVPAAVQKNWDIAPVPVAANNKTGKYPTDWLKAVGIVNGSKNSDAVASFALYKSKYKGDNKYDEYFSAAQKSRVQPYFKNIEYANYSYGTLTTKYGQLFGAIATGGDISQLISANKSVFQAEIDKVVK